MTWLLFLGYGLLCLHVSYYCIYVIFREASAQTRNLMQWIFLRSATIQQKKKAYTHAVHNAIVIDVKVDKDLLLSFLKFYDDQNMLCKCTANWVNEIVGLLYMCVIFII